MHKPLTITCTLLAALLFALAPAAQADDFTSDADAKMKWGEPDTNFGSLDLLKVRASIVSKTRKTWIRFDVSGWNSADTVAEATLTLIGIAPPDGGSVASSCDVYGLNDDHAGEGWSESTTTWNNAPGNDTTSSSAVLSADTTLLGNCVLPAIPDANGTLEITFSSAALATFVDANRTDGDDDYVTLILTNSGFRQFASKEHATENAPKLTLDVPEPATMGLLGLGFAGMAALRRRRRKA